MIIPESAKFLIEKKKYDEARKSLKFVAKFNRVKEECDFLFYHEYKEKYGLESIVEKENK